MIADKLFILSIAIAGHFCLYQVGGWKLIGGVLLINAARVLNNLDKNG